MTVNAVAMLQATTLFVLAATGVVEIWHVYVLRSRSGLRERHRDARAPGIRRRARPARGPRQRDRAQLDQLQPVARHRPRHCGRDDRCLRRGASTSASTRSATCRFLSACGCSTAAFCATSARPDAVPVDSLQPGRGRALRARDADRALAARPPGRHGHLRDELPDAPPALQPRHARAGLGRIRRAVRGARRRLAARLADPGIRDQPAADARPHGRAAARPSWCSSSPSASCAARCSPSRW